MEKSKFGVSLAFLAGLGFVFVILGQIVPLVLLCGFAVMGEKSSWFSRQTLAALILQLFHSMLKVVLEYAIGWIEPAKVFSYGKYNQHTFYFQPYRHICNIIWVIVFIFALIAFFNVIKGRESNVPGASGAANKAVEIMGQ